MNRSKDTYNLTDSFSLGPLETEVLDTIWTFGQASVRDVYRVLLTKREIAYTTVMTVMSNLAGKGVLTRHRQGRAYVYTPAFSKDDSTRAKIVEMVDSMVSRFTEPAMSYLVDRMAQVTPQKLAELEEAITRRRKQPEERLVD